MASIWLTQALEWLSVLVPSPTHNMSSLEIKVSTQISPQVCSAQNRHDVFWHEFSDALGLERHYLEPSFAQADDLYSC